MRESVCVELASDLEALLRDAARIEVDTFIVGE